MLRLTLRDLDRGSDLLKEVVRRADVNADGALRSGDLDAYRRHAGLLPSNQTWNDGSDAARVRVGINAAVGRARARGGARMEVLERAIDELEANVRSASQDGNRTLSADEQSRVRGVGERGYLDFVIWAKGKTIDDVDLPSQRPRRSPRFSSRGTPEQVCQSLLEATTKPANDSVWPAWSGAEGPARYGVDVEEARAMIGLLGSLSTRRQRAVLEALEARTQQREHGCVGPTPAAKRALEAHAGTLGLSISLGSPAVPRMPDPG